MQHRHVFALRGLSRSPMSRLAAPLVIALASTITLPPPASAQADYRNLDAGRPIAVEDAQPLEFRALEFQFGIPRFSRERSGHWLYAFELEFKWGIFKDTHFGISSEFVVAHGAGRTVSSFADTQLHLLYNFNEETPRFPAIAIRPELTVPTGGFSSGDVHGSLKLIASKTFGHNRIHFNGSWTAGPTATPGRGGELVTRYFYGLAYERTLPLKFLVLLADVNAHRPIDNSPTEVAFEIGTRVQLTPGWVLDAGISTGRLRPSVGHDFGFVFGLSRSFSFRGLFPR